MSESAIVVGEWTVDPDTSSIRRANEVRHVQPLSLKILLYLAQHAHRTISSDELITEFWPGRIVGDDAVHRRIANLRKMLDDDAKNPSYIRTVAKRGYRLVAPLKQAATVAVGARTMRRPARRLVAAVVVVAILVAVVQVQQGILKRQVSTAVARAEVLLSEDRYQAAYLELVPYIDEQVAEFKPLIEKILLPVSIHTEPPGIRVAYRFSEAGDQWQQLGVTPITDVMMPRGHYKLRFGDGLLMDATHPGVTLNSAGRARRVIALPTEATPDDMVFVPAGDYRLGAWGFVDEFDLGEFFIDRFEVSNQEFQAFVDAGGYDDPAFWQDVIDESAGRLTPEIIRREFIDLTGQPGPRYWEFGAFPPGQGALPVVGVSWYEANVYLRFRDKLMPGVHHWLRAALSPMEWKYPFASEVVPKSNVAAASLLAVDRDSSAEINGTFDMVGNAAEWTSLDSHGSKAVIGSSFRDPSWAYNFPQPRDPMERLDTVGFRGMRASTNTAAGPLPDFPLFNDFSETIRQVSDEEFTGMKHSFDYAAGTLDVGKVSVVDEIVFENWIRRQVLIPTGRSADPMPVFLFIPRHFAPPYQSVIYLPPADSWSPGFRSDSVKIENYQIDFVPRSGRVLVWPVYSGSHERYDNYHADSGPERSSLALERNRRVRDEIGRVIDYLEETAELDGSRVALMALSYGATLAPFVLSTEPRIRTAVIYSAGIAPPIPIFANPQNDPNVFWARVHQPTVLMNGRYDPIRPYEFVLEPLLELLATPPESKMLILYESGHWPLPRYLMMRDSLAWLDQHLGHPAGRDDKP